MERQNRVSADGSAGQLLYVPSSRCASPALEDTASSALHPPLQRELAPRPISGSALAAQPAALPSLSGCLLKLASQTQAASNDSLNGAVYELQHPPKTCPARRPPSPPFSPATSSASSGALLFPPPNEAHLARHISSGSPADSLQPPTEATVRRSSPAAAAAVCLPPAAPAAGGEGPAGTTAAAAAAGCLPPAAPAAAGEATTGLAAAAVDSKEPATPEQAEEATPGPAAAALGSPSSRSSSRSRRLDFDANSTAGSTAQVGAHSRPTRRRRLPAGDAAAAAVAPDVEVNSQRSRPAQTGTTRRQTGGLHRTTNNTPGRLSRDDARALALAALADERHYQCALRRISVRALAEQVGVADCTMLAHNKRWAVANIPAHLHNGSGLMTDEAKRDCIEEGLLSWEAFSRLFPRPPEMAGGA